ncbi:hypothetical protein ACMYQ1_09940 [Shewanella oncorhynchi]|uniref:hypothetical protein n=1 Tax=Shewanella oncorhynchi TaxID=2726434 RepID=UPI0039EF6238
MNWYELGNGPLRALKVLLDSPLNFDPVEYISRTPDREGKEASQDLLNFAHFYNDIRKELFPKVSGIHQLLTNSSKLNLDKLAGRVLPLKYELINSTHSTKDIYTPLLVKCCDSVNMQLDRLLESFKVSSCTGNEYNNDLDELVSFYLLSEVLFFALVGMAYVEFKEEYIFVKPSSKESVNQLHRKWFANYWEEMSSMSSIAYLDALPKGSNEHKSFKEVILLFGQGFRDKIFTFPANDLPSRLNRLESIKWVNKICNLVALCMWCKIKNEMDYAPFYLLESIGINRSDMQYLNEFVEKLPQPDRIFSVKAQGVTLNVASITNQLRIILNDIANAISENKLNELVGDFFEKEYISTYFLRDELANNYRVHKGIMAHDVKDEKLKPDVDLIIEDLRRNVFYFVQVKYLRIGGSAYILGDLNHIVSGKLSKGVGQLVDAKLAMESRKLEEILKKRGLEKCRNENSVFLLIHNISNFDFCVWPSGIVSYEWNSIRNLFKDGEVTFGHSKSEPNSWNHSQPLPIGKPDDLIEFFMKNGPMSQIGNIGTLFETDNLVVSTRIGNKELSCHGMGL